MCFPECSLADVGSTYCDRCRTQIPCLDRTRFEEEIEQYEYFRSIEGIKIFRSDCASAIQLLINVRAE